MQATVVQDWGDMNKSLCIPDWEPVTDQSADTTHSNLVNKEFISITGRSMDDSETGACFSMHDNSRASCTDIDWVLTVSRETVVKSWSLVQGSHSNHWTPVRAING